MSYAEESAQIALNSSVAVLALSNPDCTDVELLPLRPRLMSDHEQAALAAFWHGRNLEAVGVIGLVGSTPKFALKKPLGPEQVSALADAFLHHVYGVMCDGLAGA